LLLQAVVVVVVAHQALQVQVAVRKARHLHVTALALVVLRVFQALQALLLSDTQYKEKANGKR
jgi:hypothetical protein